MEKYELLLQDPLSERAAYGKKSLIVEALLRRLLEATKSGTSTIEVSDLTNILRGI